MVQFKGLLELPLFSKVCGGHPLREIKDGEDTERKIAQTLLQWASISKK